MIGATALTKYRVQFSCFSFDSVTNTSLVSALKALFDVKAITGAGYTLQAFEDNSIDSSQAPQDASEQFVYQDNVDYLVYYTEL